MDFSQNFVFEYSNTVRDIRAQPQLWNSFSHQHYNQLNQNPSGQTLGLGSVFNYSVCHTEVLLLNLAQNTTYKHIISVVKCSAALPCL